MLDNRYQTSSVLSQIHEGMSVYDAANHKIGTVSDLYLGSSADSGQEYGTGTETTPDRGAGVNNAGDTTGSSPAPLFVAPPMAGFTGLGNTTGASIGGVIPVFSFEDDVPSVERDRLLQSGFIQIGGTGILGAARYITPDQIASVQGEDIHLNIDRDQTTKAR